MIRSSIILLFFLFFDCSVSDVQQSSEISKYEEAFALILKSKKAFKLTKNIPNRIQVSEEVISFGNYASIFGKEVRKYVEFEKEELLFETEIVKSEMASLTQLSSAKSSDNHLFFSEERKGVFFGELFVNSNKKHMKYEERPDFGISYVYFFIVKDKVVRLLDVKELVYG